MNRFAPNLHSNRGCWHNHLWQICWQSVKGWQFCIWVKNAYFYWQLLLKQVGLVQLSVIWHYASMAHDVGRCWSVCTYGRQSICLKACLPALMTTKNSQFSTFKNWLCLPSCGHLVPCLNLMTGKRLANTLSSSLLCRIWIWTEPLRLAEHLTVNLNKILNLL